MIRIDGNGKMEFKMDEISEELGRDHDPAALRNVNLDPLWPDGA